MAKHQQLATEPKFDEQCKMWYFEQPMFIIGGFKYYIISTDGTFKDPKHDVRTFDNRIVQLTTSDIVKKYKQFNK